MRDGVTWRRFLLGCKGQKEGVPAVGLRGEAFDGTVVVWIHPRGKASLLRDGKLIPEARKILDGKAGILAPDVFWTGEAKGIVIQVRADAKKLEAHKLTPAKVEQAVIISFSCGTAVYNPQVSIESNPAERQHGTHSAQQTQFFFKIRLAIP